MPRSFFQGVMSVLLIGVTTLCSAQEPDVNKLAEQLKSGELESRRDAAYGLADLGVAATPAVEALIAALKDRDSQIWFACSQALARIGPAAAPAIPEFVDELDNYNRQRRYRAAYVLGSIGTPAEEALAKSLESSNTRVRESAAIAYRWMSSPSSPALDALIAALDDDDEDVRLQVGESLAFLGPPVESRLRMALESRGSPRMAVAALAAFADLDWQDEATLRLLQEFASSDQEAVRAAAIAAISAYSGSGDEVFGAVVRGLEDPSTEVRAAALAAVLRQPAQSSAAVSQLAELIRGDSADVRRLALLAISRMGVASETALPVLLERLAKNDLEEAERQAVTEAIVRLNERAVAPLLEEVDKESISPSIAAQVLGEIGTAAIPTLIHVVENGSVLQKSVATEALGQIDGAGEERQEVLLRMLSNESPTIRAAAVRGLGELETEEVAESLLARWDDPNEEVRAAVLLAVPRTGVNSPALTEMIQVALKDRSAQLRLAATEAVLLSALPVEQVASHLGSALADEDPAVRANAARGLSQLESAAVPALSQLAATLDDPSEEVRVAVADAIAAIGKEASPIAKELAIRLKDSSEPVVLAALRALRQINLDEASVALAGPAMPPLLTHESSAIRAAAAANVRQAITDASRAVELLTERLQDSEWAVRRAATLQLGEFGPAAESAVPALFDLLYSDDDRDAARSAIRDIDAVGPAALPKLIKGLESEERRVRFYAVYLLGELGPAAKEALPALRELKSDSGRFDEFIERSIAKIEGREIPDEDDE